MKLYKVATGPYRWHMCSQLEAAIEVAAYEKVRCPDEKIAIWGKEEVGGIWVELSPQPTL